MLFCSTFASGIKIHGKGEIQAASRCCLLPYSFLLLGTNRASNVVIGGMDQRPSNKQVHKSELRTRGLSLDWSVGEQPCGTVSQVTAVGAKSCLGEAQGTSALPRAFVPGEQTVDPKWEGPLFGESKG